MWHVKPQAGEEINVKVNHARLGIWISIIVPGGPAVGSGRPWRAARRVAGAVGRRVVQPTHIPAHTRLESYVPCVPLPVAGCLQGAAAAFVRSATR